MKREIKFRAWDKLVKEMYWIDGIFDGELLQEIAEGKHPEMVLMQYTGLKSNGQEWYEGDILENDSDWYQVEWDNDEGRWLAVGIGSTHESIALCELVSSETFVQGNIYENQELMTNTTEWE